jgi:hypothetical protein
LRWPYARGAERKENAGEGPVSYPKASVGGEWEAKERIGLGLARREHNTNTGATGQGRWAGAHGRGGVATGAETDPMRKRWAGDLSELHIKGKLWIGKSPRPTVRQFRGR